jgi:hypothetical protein
MTTSSYMDIPSKTLIQEISEMLKANNNLPSHDNIVWAFDRMYRLNPWLPIGFDTMFIQYQTSLPKKPFVVYSCRFGTQQTSWGVWSWEFHFRFFKWEIMCSQLTKWGIESMRYDVIGK